MSEIPVLPPEGELKTREAAQELRMEHARRLAELDEPRTLRLPLEGAVHWAKKNRVPAAAWLHGYFVRYRRLWIVAELLFWASVIPPLVTLFRRLSSR